MSTGGSDSLWQLAGTLDLVPTPPDVVLAARLAEWWTLPRRFGCVTAKAGGEWVVVAPDRRLWCASCARERFGQERRCVYCGRKVRRSRATELLFEMQQSVKVLGRAHRHCTEQAAKGDRR